MSKMKNILCMIDALGSGGAERQMVGLATMLHEEGHQVTVVYHEPKHFFAEQIRSAGVEVHNLASAVSSKKRVWEYRKFIKAKHPEVVIAYLQGACITACLVKASGLKFKLIVSERNTNQSKNWRDYIRFNLFRLAYFVVPNSYSQEHFIKENFSFLSKKTKTITNFVDTDRFVPGEPHERNNLIVVAATIWPSKNTIGLIEALAILKEKGLHFKVKWFGKVADKSEYSKKCETLIKERGLQNYIELLDKTKNILVEYQKADFFCLPSFYEGTPNVICEAMSCGLLIICSDVCDNARYVKGGENGFLFDPKDIRNMADVIEKAIQTTGLDYDIMQEKSRKFALELLSAKTFIEKYQKIISL